MTLTIINEQLINFVLNYQILIYLILFLGSFFETIFIISFFIPGELFFLTGSILAGMGYLNIWIVIFLLYLGGILGDNISFLLGKIYGKKFFKKFENKIFFRKFINEKSYLKSENYFKKYGKYSVFFARFLGPISWIFPFIAGNFDLKYSTFIKYNTPGVILGIGQFIFVGYFGGKHYDLLLNLISKYVFLFLFIIISLIFVYYYLKKLKLISLIKINIKKNKIFLFKFIIKKFTLISVIILILFSLFLVFIFFNENTIHTQNLNLNNFSNSNSLSNTNNFFNFSDILNNCSNLKTYYKDNPSYSIQPINIIIYSNNSIDKIMNSSLWIENKIFGKNKITIKEYSKLLYNKIPPVSSLYFLNKTQTIAFQEKNSSYISREHIRFWEFNSSDNNYNNLYVASISNDNGLTLQLYKKFITPVHEIDKNIDKSRNLFNNYLINSSNFNCYYIQTKCGIKKFIENEDEQQYYTDGKILLCKEK